MAKEEANDLAKIRLKMVRLSYPHLFKAKGFGKKNEGEPKFSGTAIIDPETKAGRANLALLDEAIEMVGAEKWPKDWKKIKKRLEKEGRICLREGADFDDDLDDDEQDETVGMMLLSASNAKRPLALDENGDDVVESDDILYPGCYVDMIVRIWPQDNDYGQRINASLEGVKFRKEGDAFSSVSKISREDFNDDDDDDEKPKSRRGRSRDDDDEDEKPKSRRGRSRDDDDEDEAPKSRRGRSRDDDDEDEAPKSRRGRSRDDDDEDEAPKSRRGRSRDDDDDDEDEKPKSRRGRSRDDDEVPKSRRRRDEDDDY